MSDVEQYDASKSKWMKEIADLRPDLMFPDSWGEAQRDAVLQQLKPEKTRLSMFTSIPMWCRGPNCQIASSCPLQQKGIAPMGKSCPFELALVTQFMQEYMDELNVDPDNLNEVALIRDLVDQEIQYIRKTKILSTENFIVENVVGVDHQGNPIMRRELHQAVDLEDRLHKRKRDLRNQLLATREARSKAGQSSLDTAQNIANIIEEVAKRRAEKEKELLRKAGREIVDTYIVDAEIIDDEDV